jgi:F0F1-type ATP synthase assembly protein I
MKIKDNSQLINKRIIAIAVVVICLMVGPLLIRDLNPDNVLVQELFGGLKLFIYWIIILIIMWRFDKWLSKKRTNSSGA